MTSITDLMVHDTPLFTGAAAVYPFDPKLVQRFTFIDRFDEKVQLWHPMKGGEWIALPRAMCPLGAKDVRTDGQPMKAKSKVSPRNAEQARVMQEGYAQLDEDRSFCMRAPTGSGKSVIGVDWACHRGRTTLIVVTKEDLIDHWRKEILLHTTAKEADIGYVRQDRYDVAGKDFVIALVHSLSIEGRYPSWVYEAFGTVIFDEVHRLGAEEFSKVCWKVSARVRIGMSATLRRSDGRDVVVHAHIGPTSVKSLIEEVIPKVLLYHTGWRVPRRPYRDKTTGEAKFKMMPHSPGRLSGLIGVMQKDVMRNTLIAKVAAATAQHGRTTVLFVEHTEHIDTLYGMIRGLGVRTSDMAIYDGRPQNKDGLKRAWEVPLVIATYRKMSEGTNIPQIDCCIMGTPRADVEQIVGRTRRSVEGKKEPVVIDIVDTDSPVLAGYFASRKNYYLSLGCNVKDMTR